MKTWPGRVAAALLAASCTAALASAFVDFFRAVNVDNVGVVSELLARGFDPNSANDQGQVGLFLALRDEAPRVTAVLLAQGADTGLRNGAGFSAADLARQEGRESLALKLQPVAR